MKSLILKTSSVVLTLLLASNLALAVSGTSTYTDCYGAGKCGLHDDEADTCSGNGTCPTSTWTFAEDEELDRCAYSYPDPTPGTPGQWEYVTHQSCLDSDCGSTTGTGGCGVTVSTTATESATSSYSWSVGGGLKGELNVALAAKVGIEVNAAYTSGASSTSSASVSYSDTCETDAPACGKKKAYRSAFKRDEPASTDVTFTLEIQCKSGGEICYGWHTHPWADGSCTMDADLTNASEDTTPQCVKCELTCSEAELHPDCCGSSSTSTGPCPYMTYQG